MTSPWPFPAMRRHSAGEGYLGGIVVGCTSPLTAAYITGDKAAHMQCLMPWQPMHTYRTNEELATKHATAQREAELDLSVLMARPAREAEYQAKRAMNNPELLGLPQHLLRDHLLEEIEVQEGVQPTSTDVHETFGQPVPMQHFHESRQMAVVQFATHDHLVLHSSGVEDGGITARVARLTHGALSLHPALVQREPPEHRMYGICATVSGAAPGLAPSRLADGSLDAVIAIAACRTGAVHLLTANARFLALVTSEASALFQGDVAPRPPLPAYDMRPSLIHPECAVLLPHSTIARSAVVSPHMLSDLWLATADRALLYDWRRAEDPAATTVALAGPGASARLGVPLANPWRCILPTSHPRIALLCHPRGCLRLDWRAGPTPVSLFQGSDLAPDLLAPPQRISAAVALGGPGEVVACATETHIHLVDARAPRRSLLSLAHNVHSGLQELHCSTVAAAGCEGRDIQLLAGVSRDGSRCATWPLQRALLLDAQATSPQGLRTALQPELLQVAGPSSVVHNHEHVPLAIRRDAYADATQALSGMGLMSGPDGTAALLSLTRSGHLFGSVYGLGYGRYEKEGAAASAAQNAETTGATDASSSDRDQQAGRTVTETVYARDTARNAWQQWAASIEVALDSVTQTHLDCCTFNRAKAPAKEKDGVALVALLAAARGAVNGFDNREDRHFYIRAWCVQRLRAMYKLDTELQERAPLPPLTPSVQHDAAAEPLLMRSPILYEPATYRIAQALENSDRVHEAPPALYRAASAWSEVSEAPEPPVHPKHWERAYTVRELVARVHDPETAIVWLEAYARDPCLQLRVCDLSAGTRHIDPVDCLLFVPVGSVDPKAPLAPRELLLHVPCAAANVTEAESKAAPLADQANDNDGAAAADADQPSNPVTELMAGASRNWRRKLDGLMKEWDAPCPPRLDLEAQREERRRMHAGHGFAAATASLAGTRAGTRAGTPAGTPAAEPATPSRGIMRRAPRTPGSKPTTPLGTSPLGKSTVTARRGPGAGAAPRAKRSAMSLLGVATTSHMASPFAGAAAGGAAAASTPNAGAAASAGPSPSTAQRRALERKRAKWLMGGE